MNITPQLATRFGHHSPVLRSEIPLAEDQMQRAAPSIFATGKHVSRSDRYTYIPTIEVLRGLRHEGFEPFMVAQGRSRIEGKAAYTKHMIRMRHVDQAQRGTEAHEIVLINSHDGASSYRMLAGVFRFVCGNGLVVGDIAHDIRIPHRTGQGGNLRHQVIEGAFRVLEDFETVTASTEAMKSLRLERPEQEAFATAALALRYGPPTEGRAPAPIPAARLIEPRRMADRDDSLWTTFQRVQENTLSGGQQARSGTGQRVHTRPVASIDRSVSLNRALWVLAEEMRKLKG